MMRAYTVWTSAEKTPAKSERFARPPTSESKCRRVISRMKLIFTVLAMVNLSRSDESQLSNSSLCKNRRKERVEKPRVVHIARILLSIHASFPKLLTNTISWAGHTRRTIRKKKKWVILPIFTLLLYSCLINLYQNEGTGHYVTSELLLCHLCISHGWK